jgi:3-deoxy-D-manno-octulosonate 8-phosphate phosphatase (KDO 8-P phosphatase)
LKTILERYSKDQIKRAENIKAIFFDVDGVLTDGRIIYDDAGRELKEFNVKDGQIVAYLKKAGIILGAITGRSSPIVANRCAELKVDFCHQGIINKAEVVQKLIDHYKFKRKEVAYIGDDINDLGAFALVGLSVCPADALDYVKEYANLVTTAKGGRGVLRETADLVLAANGEMIKILKQQNGSL